MAYSDFTNEMLAELGIIDIIEDNTIFLSEARKLNSFYNETIKINFTKNLDTEADREQRLITPLIDEALGYLKSENRLDGINFEVELHSPLNIDKEKSLTGFIDIMIALRGRLIKKPILAVVEAKRGLMIEHRSQLVAELYSINLQNKTKIAYGILTDGLQWEFYQLSNSGICKKTQIKPLVANDEKSWEIISGTISELIDKSYQEYKKSNKK